MVTLPADRTGWAWAVATFFGIGLIGRGAGTLASLPVVGGWLFLATHHATREFNLYFAIFAALATFVGVPASTIVARESGSKDPSHVVIDEVAGQSLALLAAPVFGWKYALTSFILFRALDIVKPPPVRQLERLPHGWGIMMDDVAAGVIACLILQLSASLLR